MDELRQRMILQTGEAATDLSLRSMGYGSSVVAGMITLTKLVGELMDLIGRVRLKVKMYSM